MTYPQIAGTISSVSTPETVSVEPKPKHGSTFKPIIAREESGGRRMTGDLDEE
jgi:hypothetical protein